MKKNKIRKKTIKRGQISPWKNDFQTTIFRRVIHFIKYHNAFTIGLALIFIIGASAMANEGVRNAVIGEKIVTEQGVDNSQLLSADLENFNINLKINNVLEDEENYYIDYAFNTIAVRDNIWQPVIKVEKFTVNKTALGNRDMGIYLAEELSEVVRGEMAYLKEAQKNERERGLTRITRTTDYTGLIGLTLDLKNKILSGYEPVVKIAEPQVIVPAEQRPLSEEVILEPTQEKITEIPQLSNEATSTASSTVPYENTGENNNGNNSDGSATSSDTGTVINGGVGTGAVEQAGGQATTTKEEIMPQQESAPEPASASTTDPAPATQGGE